MGPVAGSIGPAAWARADPIEPPRPARTRLSDTAWTVTPSERRGGRRARIGSRRNPNPACFPDRAAGSTISRVERRASGSGEGRAGSLVERDRRRHVSRGIDDSVPQETCNQTIKRRQLLLGPVLVGLVLEDHQMTVGQIGQQFCLRPLQRGVGVEISRHQQRRSFVQRRLVEAGGSIGEISLANRARSSGRRRWPGHDPRR